MPRGPVVDLEKVVNPKGVKKVWSIGDTIRNRQDITRTVLTLGLIAVWIVATLVLMVMSLLGKCGEGGVMCNTVMYTSLTGLTGVVFGFYFQKNTT